MKITNNIMRIQTTSQIEMDVMLQYLYSKKGKELRKHHIEKMFVRTSRISVSMCFIESPESKELINKMVVHTNSFKRIKTGDTVNVLMSDGNSVWFTGKATKTEHSGYFNVKGEITNEYGTHQMDTNVREYRLIKIKAKPKKLV